MLLISLLAALALGGQPTPTPEAPVPTPAASPTPTPIPPTKDVRAAARKTGFGEHADEIVRASRGAVVVTQRGRVRRSAALGSSRLGGVPDLPAGQRWPTCKGKPQTFLAQVRVSDLPEQGADLRRLGGTLLFFTAVELEDGDSSYGIWAGDCSKVIHARAGSTLQRATAPKRGVLKIPATRLRFSGRPDVPGLAEDDHLMPPLERIKIDDWERWFIFRDALRAGGMPDQLLGYSDTPNGGNGCSARAERPKHTWRHLFTFNDAWEVGDGGRLQLLIDPADLEHGRFDRVCGVFDSF